MTVSTAAKEVEAKEGAKGVVVMEAGTEAVERVAVTEVAAREEV